MRQISLSGAWEFRLDEDAAWQQIHVPGCWEELDVPKALPGPAWYRTTCEIPREFADRRVWLRFGAVSYACTISVNGHEVGHHIGLWDTFAVEITQAVTPGTPATIQVRVEKPASLTCGPDSEAVRGSFPLRETLSGFLPYVWGHIFGGIWQDVTLYATGPTVLEDVGVRGEADGRVVVTAVLSQPGTLTLTLVDPHGEVVYQATQSGDRCLAFEAVIARPRPWSPAHPHLYEARLRLDSGDEHVVRFGLRSLRVDGTTILLNERPIYPRMALSWGWYPESLYSNPGPQRVRADFARLKSLGYNGVKLCLWFPPHYYFDLADECGMLLWVELPMWLPRPTSHFRRQVFREYEQLVRQARNHPAVVLYSLGCELNRDVDAALLAPLYQTVKQLAGDALVRDNSGSGEAFGGLLTEFAEYYDYHFYGEPPFFRPLIDHFLPRWRPQLPWLFGEFCDCDTFRDLRALRSTDDGTPPWWVLADTHRNPQGARWQFDVVAQEARLRANGYWDRGEELERRSEQQALLYRKYILELVRTYREISGYVVTGEADSPISTAGMWNDLGRLKFDAEQFRTFNQDLLVLVGWDRRRTWIAGGNRSAYWDTYSYTAGSTVRPHLIASHYGTSRGPAHVEWSVSCAGKEVLVSGQSTTPFTLQPGTVRELTVAEFVVPAISTPCQATLRASLSIGNEQAENSWPLWFFPSDAWGDISGVALIDPRGRLDDLSTIAPTIHDRLDDAVVAIATAWTPAVQAFAEQGGAVVVLRDWTEANGPLPMLAMPFWREALRIVEPHPAWMDFPHGDLPGWQFLGCVTDRALDTSRVVEGATPILRRLDTRTMQIHDYATEMSWGRGHVIVSTLRFEGGLGDQPTGISRNTAAAYLLHCWVRYLRRP